ncbi:MAG: NifB/NifX family molybdenum-iron cluster-binding protein [Anaerolineales bacterium]|nr:NifB/NifX family molybdenum-iron cluster-binding protein [Anaerolineales bacterium]
MKLAITVTAPRFDASLDPRFGRGAYFIIIDTETRAWETFSNPAVNTGGGAGAQAAQFIAEMDAMAIISGRFGPTAYTALDAAGIQMYVAEGAQADELLDEFVAGRLEPISAATGPGFHHSGQGRRG